MPVPDFWILALASDGSWSFSNWVSGTSFFFNIEDGNFKSFGRYFVDSTKDGQQSEIDSMFDADSNPFLGQMAMMISKARISTI